MFYSLVIIYKYSKICRNLQIINSLFKWKDVKNCCFQKLRINVFISKTDIKSRPQNSWGTADKLLKSHIHKSLYFLHLKSWMSFRPMSPLTSSRSLWRRTRIYRRVSSRTTTHPYRRRLSFCPLPKALFWGVFPTGSQVWWDNPLFFPCAKHYSSSAPSFLRRL